MRIILGERSLADSDADNVYTRAARHLNNALFAFVDSLAKVCSPACPNQG